MELTEPADHTADNIAGRQRNVQIQRLSLAKPGCLQKHDRVAEDGVSAKNLGGPNDAVDLGASKVGALEAVEERRSHDFGGFQTSDMLNVCQRSTDLLGVEVR